MTGQWKTLKEAGEILGVSESTIRRRIKQDDIQSKVENNKRLILIQEVNQMTGQMTEYAHLKTENERLLQENAELKEQLKHRDSQLQVKDEQTAEASNRHDTIVLQLTRHLEQSQRLLEYHEEPFYRRWFRRKRTPTGEGGVDQ